MSDTGLQEQTIVISDLLSFLSCKLNLTTKEKLLRTLRQYYSEKEICEAHQTLLASLPEKKSTRHGRRVKHPDPLIAIYDCFQLISENDLPIFVCKNLNNVPELDTAIKLEPQDDDDEEQDADTDVEKSLREEQKVMRSQIADIAFVVKQLKDQLQSITQQASATKSSPQKSDIKKRKENLTEFKPQKKKTSELHNLNKPKTNQNVKKKGLAYLQSLIDEDEDRSDREQSEKDNNSDFQDELDSSDIEYEELEDPQESESISCEVVLKEEAEDLDSRFCKKKGNLPQREIGSPSKDAVQKVIYIKNNERDDLKTTDDENSIEIASTADYIGNLEDTDSSSRIDSLDSIITIAKNSPTESIVIEKIEATNGEGFYYKCQRCGFICNEEKMIFKHQCSTLSLENRHRKPRRKNRDENMLTCTICEVFVLDVVEFNEHMLDHYKVPKEEGFHECVLCPLKTDNYEEYRSHLSEHSWKIPYACELCDYRSTKELRMRNHALKHLECKGPHHFQCLICGKICGTRNALEKHKQRHKKNYDFKCDICGLTFRHRSALSQHTLNHTKERTFVCQICSYRYESQHSLDVHVKVHFRDESYTCHVCNQKFKSKNSFRSHVLSDHRGVKAFKCDVCDEAFIFKHTMLMHRKTHGNQLYVCRYCNKKFKSPHYLKVHCAIHEGKNPFKCSSCDFNTTSKSVLKKHMASHPKTEISLLSCEYCTFVTVSQADLENHSSSSHGLAFDDGKMVIIMEEES